MDRDGCMINIKIYISLTHFLEEFKVLFNSFWELLRFRLLKRWLYFPALVLNLLLLELLSISLSLFSLFKLSREGYYSVSPR